MEEYHRTLSRRIKLSSTIRVMNATSPPGVHISPADPVHDSCKDSVREIQRMVQRIWLAHEHIVPLRRRKKEDCTCRNQDYISRNKDIPIDPEYIEGEERSFRDCGDKFDLI
jgi:hypothetical protein